jgi:hypothetical protein
MVRLFLASATALFLELACIRWAGAHVLYLSYVSNFLLIATFFGLGLGALFAARMLAGGRERAVAVGVGLAPVLLVALVAVISFVEVEVVVSAPDAIYFRNENGGSQLPPWVVLPLLGLLVAATFSALGCAIGRELGHAKPLRAYTVDIAGSLVGIALFGIASFASVPAAAWFVCAALAWLPLVPGTRGWIAIGAASAIALGALVAATDFGSLWSPYYRITVVDEGPAAARFPGDPTAGSPLRRLKVNDVTHQIISDVRRREPFYEFPYRAAGATLPGGDPLRWLSAPPMARHEPPGEIRPWGGRVLVIGAGNGTDLAFALAYGASSIDAVEIDPLLAAIGRDLQPNRPYDDPRVHLFVEDGRTFLERTKTTYDLVVFALPDSLTLVSPYASLRLESFLFTVESFRRAMNRLDPEHGLVVVYNYYREPWLVRRLGATLEAATGAPPRIFVGPDKNLSAVYMAGPGLANVPRDLGHEWGFVSLDEASRAPAGSIVRAVASSTPGPAPTDDWPFLYLHERTIPAHLAEAMAALVAFALLAVAAVLGWGRGAPLLVSGAGGTRTRLIELLPFFLMGVAFLLLETAGLVRMALLFGVTWLVNALVIFAILLMVLLANTLASRMTLARAGPTFAALLAALIFAWTVPPSALSGAPLVVGYAATSILFFGPILLANLVFARAFRDARDPALAFGANLAGAVLGGALEYVSLSLGHRALFLVAAAVYAGAAVATRAQDRARLPAPRAIS